MQKETVKVSVLLPKENMMDNGLTIKCKEKEFSIFSIKIDTKANFLLTRCTVKENTMNIQGQSMMGSSKIIKRMDMEYRCMTMENTMKDNGKMDIKMVKDIYSLMMAAI